MAEAGRNGVERVGEVAPFGRGIGSVGGELAARPLPPGERRLRFGDLFGTHPLEIIVFRIVLANMVEAQEAPMARSIEIRRLQRRLKFAGRIAAGDRAPRLRPLDPPVHLCMFHAGTQSSTRRSPWGATDQRRSRSARWARISATASSPTSSAGTNDWAQPAAIVSRIVCALLSPPLHRSASKHSTARSACRIGMIEGFGSLARLALACPAALAIPATSSGCRPAATIPQNASGKPNTDST